MPQKTNSSNDKIKKNTRYGMILGKFLPPHKGHQYLIDFARNYVSDLTVVIGSLKQEPIPGDLRFSWLQEMFPHVRVIHLNKELPQYPEEHPDFWSLWQKALLEILPFPLDFVFASEDYGKKLAEVLSADFIPVDQNRNVIPISATKIRANPFAYWDFIASPARPYFLKRVCVFGPESTGKTTLCQKLANYYQTQWVPEYARHWIENKNGVLCSGDMFQIAKGQLAAQKALENQAKCILFSDTDFLLSKIWDEFLFEGQGLNSIEMEESIFDHYLVCDVDVPFVEDSCRYLPDERQNFFDRCVEILNAKNLPYTIIKGDWDERWKTALRVVDSLLKHPPSIDYQY